MQKLHLIGASRMLNLYAMPARQMLLGRAMRGLSMLNFNRDLDYYGQLGLTKTATQDDIKMKFYELAKKHHPDSCQSKPSDEEKFK
mmetsp:Transcript_4046/g.4932  ORF Transcript_4046/g.4932 Transcript_4046/m.4932 type:complete len:86 (+) Transcript_4046:78-335(+)